MPSIFFVRYPLAGHQIASALLFITNRKGIDEKAMHDQSLQIYVAVKHMGNVTKKVKKSPFFLAQTPQTFEELIEESVRSCISAYKTRDKGAQNPAPLSNEQFDAMRELGKFAFGFHHNQNAIDEEKAIATAIEAVKDGLVRVFKGKEELTDLQAEIEINEHDIFTFIRLTMLSGRMW